MRYYYCQHYNMATDVACCLNCQHENKIVFNDRIACPAIRLINNRNINVAMPLNPDTTISVQELLPETDNNRILILREHGGIGDIICITPTIKALWHEYHIPIDFYCKPQYKAVLKNNPYIATIITDKDLCQQKKHDYYMYFDFDNPCPIYIYEKDCLKNKKPITKPYIDLFCEQAGINPDSKFPDLFVEPLIDNSTRKWLARYPKPWIGLAPISERPYKNWLKGIKQLAQLIKAKFNTTLFILHKKELHIPDTISFNADLDIIIGIINNLDLIISVDTGIIHIAGTLKKPTIGLFGSTNPYRILTYYKTVDWIWEKDKLDCCPCYFQPECIVYPPACMKAITPEMIMNKIIFALKGE